MALPGNSTTALSGILSNSGTTGLPGRSASLSSKLAADPRLPTSQFQSYARRAVLLHAQTRSRIDMTGCANGDKVSATSTAPYKFHPPRHSPNHTTCVRSGAGKLAAVIIYLPASHRRSIPEFGRFA